MQTWSQKSCCSAYASLAKSREAPLGPHNAVSLRAGTVREPSLTTNTPIDLFPSNAQAQCVARSVAAPLQLDPVV